GARGERAWASPRARARASRDGARPRAASRSFGRARDDRGARGAPPHGPDRGARAIRLRGGSPRDDGGDRDPARRWKEGAERPAGPAGPRPPRAGRKRGSATWARFPASRRAGWASARAPPASAPALADRLEARPEAAGLRDRREERAAALGPSAPRGGAP